MSTDEFYVSDTLAPYRPRAIFSLNRHGRQAFVLSENDVIFLSTPVKTKAELNDLLKRLEDPQANPALLMGPLATVIPLSQVIGVKIHGARGFLDIETAHQVHRVAGWKGSATVLAGERLHRPLGLPSFGGPAIEEAARRIQLRRHGLPEEESIDGQTRHSEPALITPEFAEQIELRNNDLSFTPIMVWVEFLKQVVVLVFFTALAIFVPDIRQWMFGLVALATFWTGVRQLLPGPVRVGMFGIEWGRWVGKRILLWENAKRFEFVEPRLGKPRVFYITAHDEMRVALPFTQLMSNNQVDQLRRAIAPYRTCIDRSTQLAPWQTDEQPSDKRARRNKPTVSNEISRAPRWQFWSLGILVALTLPFLLVTALLILT